MAKQRNKPWVVPADRAYGPDDQQAKIRGRARRIMRPLEAAGTAETAHCLATCPGCGKTDTIPLIIRCLWSHGFIKVSHGPGGLQNVRWFCACETADGLLRARDAVSHPGRRRPGGALRRSPAGQVKE